MAVNSSGGIIVPGRDPRQPINYTMGGGVKIPGAPAQTGTTQYGNAITYQQPPAESETGRQAVAGSQGQIAVNQQQQEAQRALAAQQAELARQASTQQFGQTKELASQQAGIQSGQLAQTGGLQQQLAAQQAEAERALAGLQNQFAVGQIGLQGEQSSRLVDQESEARLAQLKEELAGALQQIGASGDIQGKLLGQRAQLSDASFDKRLGAVTGLLGGIGGETTGGPSYGVTPNEEAARQAAFAREKDTLGQILRAAMTGLTNSISERGLVGSGFEGQGVRDIIAGGQGQLGNVAREQTIQDLGRAREVADRDYAGNLTRRGQDLAFKNALLGLINAGPIY